MPISFRHKLLFVHVPKTAGTSVRQAMSWIDKQLFVSFRHLTLGNYKSYLSTMYDEMFKFAVVRNPWDRAVSMYFYDQTDTFRQSDPERYEKISKMSFEQFLDYSSFALRQAHWISINGKIDVDYVGRFEDLDETARVLARKSNSPRLPLPHVNSTKHPPYQDMYNNRTRKILAQKCEEDIDTFKYSFEGSISHIPLL